MPVTIAGNVYHTVAERVREFRRFYRPEQGWRLTTSSVGTEKGAHAVAQVVDPQGNIMATGTAERTHEEAKKLGGRVVEFAETGAVGRALFLFGITFDGEDVASADDVGFLETESLDIEAEYMPRLLSAIKNDDAPGARELWDELNERGKSMVWRLTDSHKKGALRKLLQQSYDK